MNRVRSRVARLSALLLALFTLCVCAFAPLAGTNTAKHPPERVNSSWMNMQDGWYAQLEAGLDKMDPMTAQFTAAVIGYGDMSYDLSMSFVDIAQEAYDITKSKKDGDYSLTFAGQSSGDVTKKQNTYSLRFQSEVVEESSIDFSIKSGAMHMDLAFYENDQCPAANYIDLIPVGTGFYTCYIFQDATEDYGAPLVLKQYMDKERIYIVFDYLPAKPKISSLRLQSAPKKHTDLAGKESMVISLDKNGNFKLSNLGDVLEYKIK